jgi:hypothetical protein
MIFWIHLGSPPLCCITSHRLGVLGNYHSVRSCLLYRVRRVCSPLKWQTIPLTTGRKTTGQKTMRDYAKVMIRLMRRAGGRLSVVW